MDENTLEAIINVTDLNYTSKVIQDFITNNETSFSFPSLNKENKRAVLWTALFQHIQQKSLAPIHVLCLKAIRVLSRDKTDLDNLLCEKWITVLIEKAGLYNFSNYEDEEMINIELPEKDVAVEALKCLYNFAFNSDVGRALCSHSSIAQGLVTRLRLYKDIPYKDDIIPFDMKLLFILTALRQDIKTIIKKELHGMDYLISCLNEVILEATNFEEVGASASGGLTNDGQHCILSDHQQEVVCEILKIQFNLTANESEESVYLKLMPLLAALLNAQISSEEKLMELHSNVANLLTNVPPDYYQYLTPDLNEGEKVQFMYENKNMDALQALVQLLQYRLTINTNTTSQRESLSPILTVMTKASRGCRAHRKYLRRVVLPPLRDVSRPPESGVALRNQLCRLLTTPVTLVRDLVAEFLFILCKEKVGRLVKYTGYGNAAGHLAQRGLLAGGDGGGGGGGGYSSSSDDSDTEEYRRAQPHIDPVVGCTRPPRADPFHGMTDEQKEYEAMKLVNLFDKLVSSGAVKPARVGSDGRPQPLEHVLEMRDPPNRHAS